jgi:cyclopropane fatty-acyl-phospholipid synthase-like methyltransferase
LRKKYGVEVWSVDLFRDPSSTLKLAKECNICNGLYPMQIDARRLPFARGFFDVILCIDSLPYFGTDDLYAPYLASFLKPGGLIGMAGAGLTEELIEVPSYFDNWWIPEMWSYHSASWWANHWRKSCSIEVLSATSMEEGWSKWLDWQKLAYPKNLPEISALESDKGKHLSYIKVVGKSINFVEKKGILKFSSFG